MGNELVVIVARDKNAKRCKSHVPSMSEKERVHMIQHRKMVNKAVLGSLTDKMGSVVRIKPDVIALGHDHSISISSLKKELAKRKVGCEVVCIPSFKVSMYKSSRIKERVVHASQKTST
ncbi:MAG: FAD synthase [Candidatus Diapherotrites archaeon]